MARKYGEAVDYPHIFRLDCMLEQVDAFVASLLAFDAGKGIGFGIKLVESVETT